MKKNLFNVVIGTTLITVALAIFLLNKDSIKETHPQSSGALVLTGAVAQF